MRNLEQLGLYESQPKDRSLRPWREPNQLAHLILGDAYPAAEIEQLQAWYRGRLRYRAIGPPTSDLAGAHRSTSSIR